VRPLADQAVVLVGASAGIGRATAHELSRRGVRGLVLVGRDDATLGEVAKEVAPTPVVTAVADVADAGAVEQVAARAAAELGRLDAWVQLASVATYSTVEQTSYADVRRVIEVDLLGAIHGLKAAVPYLRAAGGGVLVSVTSVLGRRSVPLLSTYCAAKHGILGFTESLRLELTGTGVHVVDVLPASINTPFFDNAKSAYTGHPRSVPPFYEPEVVARAIADVLAHPVREVTVGGAGKALELLQRISPALTDAALRSLRVSAWLTSRRPDEPRDNLRTPTRDPHVRGDFGSEALGRSAYTEQLGLHPWRARALGAAFAAGTFAAVRRSGRR
jgi:short-subunit dehydrogenase